MEKKIKKYCLRYFFFFFQLKRDENFLIKQGIKKAKEQGLEIKLGNEILTLNRKKRGIISLPSYDDGVDARKLIVLATEDYPEIVERYLNNKNRLNV